MPFDPVFAATQQIFMVLEMGAHVNSFGLEAYRSVTRATELTWLCTSWLCGALGLPCVPGKKSISSFDVHDKRPCS